MANDAVLMVSSVNQCHAVKARRARAGSARLAGVSASTVSHVLNRTRRVGPETRARVNAAIHELAPKEVATPVAPPGATAEARG